MVFHNTILPVGPLDGTVYGAILSYSLSLLSLSKHMMRYTKMIWYQNSINVLFYYTSPQYWDSMYAKYFKF